MKHTRKKVLCVVGVLLAASTVYACCGMYPNLTVTVAPEPGCVGESVKIKGTISATESWDGSYSTDASVAIQVTSPGGTVMNLAVTMSNLKENPGPPPSASWDYSAKFTATEVGTYSYVVIGSWTTWFGTETTSDAGRFEVIVCNRPPDCSGAKATPDCLWPPNNKMVPVKIVGVTDPDGDPVTITIDEITSDEATATAKGAAGPKHAPDADGIGTDTAMLRAERSGLGNGRVYRIYFTARDDKGAKCKGKAAVCVPHDQSEPCQCKDDGQKYDATQIN